MFLNIKSPFVMGDIVMGEGFGRPGVVASGHDNDLSFNFNYDHVRPFGLWKIDTWDDKEYWEILKFMSNAIRQNVDLLTLDYLMHEYSGHY